MNTPIRFAVAAAAVTLVAVAGISLVPRDGGSGAPVATPAPTASPTPAVSRLPAAGRLAPGTYLVEEGSFSRGAFVFTVPEGWSHVDGNFIGSKGDVETDVFVGDGVVLASWIVSHVYGDSCQWEGSLVEVLSTAELIDALAAQKGHQTAGPTEVMLGGLPATRLELSVPADFDASACDSAFMRLWPDAGPREEFGLPITPGMTTTVYVVELNRQPTLIAAIKTETSSAADVAELEQVVSSIDFQP